jgi:hypothetical protein
MQETGRQKIDIDEVEKQMRLWVDDVIVCRKWPISISGYLHQLGLRAVLH